MNEKKYHPSGLNSTFPYDENCPFTDYLRLIRKMISQSRVDLLQSNGDLIVDANSPFEWNPAPGKKIKNGVLLIHGLLDSPFSLRDMGQFFLDRGFLVQSILLPGHGTRPGDLLEVTVNAWIKASHYGLTNMLNKVDNLYVCAVSGGASLALYHLYNQMPIKGLFLFAPSIKLKSRTIPFAHYLKQFNKFNPDNWYKKERSYDFSKYHAFPLNLAFQAYELTQKIKKLQQQNLVEVPLFMILSSHDETISSRAALKFFIKQPNPLNRLIIYDNVPHSNNDERIEYRMSAYPEKDIINFSHVCLHIAPNNPHYGQQGDYKGPICQPQITGKGKVHYGALCKKNPCHYPIQRLTYNPDFDYLLAEMANFLEKITNSSAYSL